MGAKRQLTEKVKQSMNAGDFEKTSKVRIAATYEELSHFAKELRAYKEASQKHMHGVRDFNRSTKHFLLVTKPRMHEETKDGESRALNDETRVGDFVNFDKLTTTSTEHEEKMYKSVQEPLHKWLVNYDAVTKSMKSIEKQRLMLDSRRRKNDKLAGKVERMREKKEADDPKVTKLAEQKRNEEVKMGQVDGEFRGKERALYEDMQGLVADIQPVQLHVLKFYDFMRSLNDGIVKAFPKGAADRIGGDSISGGVGTPTGGSHAGFHTAAARAGPEPTADPVGGSNKGHVVSGGKGEVVPGSKVTTANHAVGGPDSRMPTIAKAEDSKAPQGASAPKGAPQPAATPVRT